MNCFSWWRILEKRADFKKRKQMQNKFIWSSSIARGASLKRHLLFKQYSVLVGGRESERAFVCALWPGCIIAPLLDRRIVYWSCGAFNKTPWYIICPFHTSSLWPLPESETRALGTRCTQAPIRLNASSLTSSPRILMRPSRPIIGFLTKRLLWPVITLVDPVFGRFFVSLCVFWRPEECLLEE